MGYFKEKSLKVSSNSIDQEINDSDCKIILFLFVEISRLGLRIVMIIIMLGYKLFKREL